MQILYNMHNYVNTGIYEKLYKSCTTQSIRSLGLAGAALDRGLLRVRQPRRRGAARSLLTRLAVHPRPSCSGGRAMSDAIKRGRTADLLGLGAFLALCLAIAALGGWATAQSVGSWYQTLQKPVFNPPDWVFAPVWTLLYFMIALAGWRVWRRYGFARAGPALAVYAVQLALNLAWSFLFFGERLVGAALVEIALLLAAIGINAVLFFRLDRLAGWLLVPYAGWVAFACALNFALWRLN